MNHAPDIARARLEDLGVRPTAARVQLLAELIARKDHPTAAQLIEAIRLQGDAAGVATLHQNLARLVEEGAIRRLVDPTGIFRFDGCLEVHHHLVCTRCGEIRDWTGPNLDTSAWVAPLLAEGWSVQGLSLRFEGLCPSCSEHGALSSQ